VLEGSLQQHEEYEQKSGLIRKFFLPFKNLEVAYPWLEHSKTRRNVKNWGPGTREKVRSKRINLEGNTHAQEINVSQCPV
jgi:hypothetical protein